MAKTTSSTRGEEGETAVLLDETVAGGGDKTDAGGAKGVADGEGAAEGVELVKGDLPNLARGARLAAELLVVEGGQVGQDLGGEGLVDLEDVKVGEGELVAVQQAGHGVGRAQQQLFLGVLGGPDVVAEDGLGLDAEPLGGLAGGNEGGGGAVGGEGGGGGGDGAVGLD